MKMDLQKANGVLLSIVDILEHVQNVQDGVASLLEKSALSFHEFLEEKSLKADEKVLNAYQYQDVMKQQLSALSQAVIVVEKSIRAYVYRPKDEEVFCENIDKLLVQIKESLQVAKQQQEDFSGNALDKKHHEEVEFF